MALLLVLRCMRRLTLGAAVLAVSVTTAFPQAPAPAAAPPAKGAAAAQPPLVDRELFFGNPEIKDAELSPDGLYVAFIKPYKDTGNVWIKKAGEPFSAARLVTADTKRPIPGYFWSRDSKYILYVQDNAGDENYNVFAVNPSDPPAPGQDAPAARNLTEAKGTRAAIYAVPKPTPDIIYVGLNDRDAAWHDVYKVTISTGARELVRRNTDRIAGWLFDNQGSLRMAERVSDAGDSELLEVTSGGLKTIYTCTVLESCNAVRFNKDDTRLYVVSNKGDTNLIRLVLLDPASGREELVESDPLKRVDLENAVFSDRTNELMLTVYEDDRQRLYFRDEALEADYKFLNSRLPGRQIEFASSTLDEHLWIVRAHSDVEPGETYLYDRGTKALALQYKIREKLPRSALAPMQSVRYPSSDGLDIPAYLTLPKGLASQNLPLIVVPHGGPWGRDTWGYDGMAQFLANRGYAVLQPNFRASTGYGKKFMNAGNGQWGDKMQDDLTWGVKHLVAQGVADPKRIGIMGGSYGGYATLAGVAFTPDLYAAAVAIVAPSNLLTLLETIPPYWEAIRTIFYTRMGNPATPEGKKQLERQSPLNSAGKIKTPLLVVQGANDPRVKRAESDQIVIALRDRGFPVEYLVAPDEGHGFARPVNNMAMFASAEKFLAHHLQGRYQESATPEVAARLTAITVDPKTVTLQKKVEAASVTAPKPSSALRAGTSKDQATIGAGGQDMKMTITEVITQEGGAWVATETAATPMGDMTDSTTLENGSLVATKRAIRQGPFAVDLAFADGKATGTIGTGDQPKPVAVDLGGPVFADGGGSHAVIATLPLAEGYTATYRNFDVQKQKPSLKQLKVIGSEQVTVAAGTFTAWKVQLTSAEGDPGETTLWIAKDSRQVVKIAATLPQMGNAAFAAELMP